VSFEEKRQLLEMFDGRGKLTVENNEKVVYVSCLLKPQPVSHAPTSHWRCNSQYLVTARLVLPKYIGRNERTPPQAERGRIKIWNRKQKELTFQVGSFCYFGDSVKRRTSGKLNHNHDPHRIS
jgi:hypothetical protein